MITRPLSNSSIKCSGHHNRTSFRSIAGFTLLEVLIGVAILAIAFVTLLGTQAKTISLATKSDFQIKAPMLATEKMAAYESGLMEIENGNGDFKNMPQYTWNTRVEEYRPDNLTVTEEEPGKLHKLTLTISLAGSRSQYSVTYYHYTDSEDE